MNEFIFSPLDEEMRCGMFTNAQGNLLIVHDRAFQAVVEWLEYDRVENKLFLVYAEGQIQALHFDIDHKMAGNLALGTEVMLIQLSNKVIQSSKTVMVIIRDI